MPLAGAKGGRRAGGRNSSSIGWAASSHPTYELWILGSYSCTAHSFLPSGVCLPCPCPASRPSYAQWVGTLSVQTPGPLVALTLGPQAEETEIESSPDVWKKSKMQKQKEVKLEPECLGLNHLVTV